MGKLKDFTDKVWYGAGAVGLDLSYGMFNGKLAKYQTDILKLDTRFLLGLTTGARIWDGVNDPMMGSIVDNTNTKFGRYRPWVVTGAALNAFVLFFLFFNPGFSTAPASKWLYVYAAAAYVLWGMTNTAADIPYWSMVPSFTTDPNQRSILATVARTFSGLGQGIVIILSPMILNRMGNAVVSEAGKTTYEWTQNGYTVCAAACAVLLVFFSVLSMSKVKESVPVKSNEKFSFRRIFDVIRQNDQLRIFMLFAMLSNAGFYTTTGVQDYFFDIVLNNTGAQSTFSLFGTIGSILGLGVIPVMMKITSRRRTYQTSLIIALLGYIGMFCSGQFASGSLMPLNIFFLLTQIGTASMFVSQTVFLADIVDYGEVKMGKRAESVTFSMKGFLQKMAYTLQTVILNVSLSAVNYTDVRKTHIPGTLYPANVRSAVSSIMYIIPPVFFVLSLIVFTSKFKLHGEYMESITEKVTKAKQSRVDEALLSAEKETV